MRGQKDAPEWPHIGWDREKKVASHVTQNRVPPLSQVYKSFVAFWTNTQGLFTQASHID